MFKRTHKEERDPFVFVLGIYFSKLNKTCGNGYLHT